MEMNTIPKTIKRLHEDGYGISMRSLRQWVRDGDIPSVTCVNRPYLWYPNVLNFLQQGNSIPEDKEPEPDNNGIRRIS